MRRINLFVVSILTIFFAGCSAFSKLDRTDDYKYAQPDEKEIAIPTDLSSKNIETFYKVPAVGTSAPKAKASIEPPGSSIDKKQR